jgi:CO/xanthine dehydrogenase FAD-binding subunit
MVATFDYQVPGTLEEALDLLAQHGDDAKVLAGGQSLIALINLGLAQPALLVDINRLPELDRVDLRDGALSVGALTRHASAERSETIRRGCPLLAEALPLIGDPQVRNRGTIGGSMAHADPVAELPTVAVCLEAVMRVQSRGRTREIPAADFFLNYLTTALGPGDLLTEVRFPVVPAGTGVSFQELVRRKGDFAIVAAAAAVGLAPDGSCTSAHLALAGVAPTPLRRAAASDVLLGTRPTPDLLRQAARACCEGLEPESDIMASAQYRQAMAEVYARRALETAVQRANRP